MTPIYPDCECGTAMEFIGIKPGEAWFCCTKCGRCRVYEETE